MTVYSDKLREMISDAPDQSDNLANSISQVTDIKDDVQDQIDAITNGLCTPAETQARSIIDGTILTDKGGDYISYGGTFGTIDYSTGNITDWEVIKIIPPVPPDITPTLSPIYSYTPGDYTDLDQLVDDYDFGNDYLTRPLTSGATYGLIPYKTNLDSAISILTNNKSKIDASESYFEEYAT